MVVLDPVVHSLPSWAARLARGSATMESTQVADRMACGKRNATEVVRLSDDMTRPERFCERATARRIRSEIYRRGGCGCCIHRDKESEAWDRAYCIQLGRSFPLCLKTSGIGFELDEIAIKGDS